MKSGLVGLLVCAATMMAACSSTATDDASPVPKLSGSAGAASETTKVAECANAHPSNVGFPEIRGEAPDGETLWGLVFTDVPVLQGDEVKIVWSMTGQGPVTLSATGPDRTEIEPTWGPEAHGESNWSRPGEEWGSGWVFPAPGCWSVQVRRGASWGLAAIEVRS